MCEPSLHNHRQTDIQIADTDMDTLTHTALAHIPRQGIVGEPLHWTGDKDTFMASLVGALNGLAAEAGFPAWE